MITGELNNTRHLGLQSRKSQERMPPLIRPDIPEAPPRKPDVKPEKEKPEKEIPEREITLPKPPDINPEKERGK